MAIPHASPGQVINVRPLNERLANTKTFAIFKSEDLQVIRLVLKTGELFPSHSVAGEITIHCIEGSIKVSCKGSATILVAGEMLFLERNAEHAVDAIDDASALVTIAIKS